MAISRKKVVVRKLDKSVLAGYLPVSGLVNASGRPVEVLDTAGKIVPVALSSIRHIAYVRDFNLSDQEDPERLSRKAFLARPRSEGLWVRVTFQDGDTLEGLAALDLALLEDAARDEGIYLVPPDVRSNTHRVFVPRAAMAEMQVLGVITTPSKPPPVVRRKQRHENELNLPFPEAGSR